MRISVRLFGGLTDRAGASRLAVELDDGATVRQLRLAIGRQAPALAAVLDSVKVAVDLEVADDTTRIVPDSEVALLPPVAGGAGREGDVLLVTGLQPPPFDVAGTIESVTAPDVGASAVFLGTVRDHAPGIDRVVGLEYSAYRAMAEKLLARIAREIAADHPEVRGIALLHAVGDLEVGDQTILIVCTSAHRAAAFAACSDALERVKDRVPIFKREVLEGGAYRWVGLPAPEVVDAGVADGAPTDG